jgi:xanthine dehydrogenase molybdopterin-binding subunit B
MRSSSARWAEGYDVAVWASTDQPSVHAVDREMLVRQQADRPRLRRDGGEEHPRDIAAHQPLAVLAERAMRPDRRVKVQAA